MRRTVPQRFPQNRSKQWSDETLVLLFLAVLTIMIVLTPAAHAASCESLKSLSLENATITLAQPVAAGEFSLPSTGRGAAQQNNAFKQLPAFCRVAVTLKPF
jgi:hypothetical protein